MRPSTSGTYKTPCRHRTADVSLGISCSQASATVHETFARQGPSLRGVAFGTNPCVGVSGPHRSRCPVALKAAPQLAGPPTTAAATSKAGAASLTTEALRPRALSAPVIARLIRSTTTLQELADVVQQQSQYFDSSHVSIALLHLALLCTRQQQQQQRQQQQQQQSQPARTLGASSTSGFGDAAAGSANSGVWSSTAAPAEAGISSARCSGSLNGNGNGGYWDNGNGNGVSASGRAGAGAAAAAWGDADEPLQMSSLVDDDDDDDVIKGGGGDNHADGGYAGGHGAGGVVQGWDDPAASSSPWNLREGGSRAGGGQPEDWLDAAAAVAAVELPPPTAAIFRDTDTDTEAQESARDIRVVPTSASTSGAAAAAAAAGGGLGAAAATAPASRGSSNGNGGGRNRAPATAPAAASLASSSGAGRGAPAPSSSSSGAASASPPPGPGTSPSPSPVSSALRTLLPLVFSRLDSLSGSNLSSCVSSLALLRYGDREVVEQLLQALAPKLYDCKAQELPNMMCSAALLGVQPDPGVRTSFYAAVRFNVRRLGPRDLALTMWAYGAVGTDIPEDAVQLLLEASRPRLMSFSPLHLAKMAQGLAALRYRPPPEWVDSYCEALRPALRRMTPRELCAVLLALASLQVGLDDTTRATLLVHTLTVLPSLAPSELALAMWALGRLTAAGLPALIDLDMSGRVLDLTYGRLGAFSGGELQQLLEGLTRLALQPPLEWMQAYVAALQPQLKDLDARQLAGVLGSLAAQQYRPMPEMQQVVLAATEANMQQLLADTTCTTSLITALRRLNIEPPPGWVGALLDASRSALKNRCTDLHLANLAGSLAAWGVKPDGRWAARLMWRSQALMVQNRMSPRALVALLQAMTSLGLRPNEVWTRLCLRAAAARASQPAFEPQHFSTLLASLYALGVRPPQEWLTRMLLSTYRCWDRFNMSHWSSMLPALVLLQARPPRAWLRRLEATTAPRLADCSALQLLTLLVSLHHLHYLQAAGASAAGPGPAPSPSPSPSPAAEATATAGATAAAGAGAGAALPVGAFRQQTHAATLQERQVQPPQQHQQLVLEQQMQTHTPQQPHHGKQRRQKGGDNMGPLERSAAAVGHKTATVGANPAESGDVAAPNPPRSPLTPHPSTQAAGAAGAAAAEPLSVAVLAAAVAAGLRPGGEWGAAWWAASTRLLVRMRYAPSELALTAGWLASLELRPPPEWLQACADVAQRYSKVMDPAGCQQLARAVMPLVVMQGPPAGKPPGQEPASNAGRTAVRAGAEEGRVGPAAA